MKLAALESKPTQVALCEREPSIEETLEQFRCLTEELCSLNRTDPLPEEFDRIMHQTIRLREHGGL